MKTLSNKVSSLPLLQSTSLQPQVLVMLSDPILENLYRQQLNFSNFCLVWCENGEGFRKTLSRTYYDIIVLDLSLAQYSPIKLLLEVKKLAPESEIIVLSKSDDTKTVISSFKVGITDFFIKPIHPEALNLAIEKILRKKSLHTNDRGLKADLKVFGQVQQIGVSDSEAEMRQIAFKHLKDVLKATSGFWHLPLAKNIFYESDKKVVLDVFEKFRKTFPNFVEDSFQNHLTLHPEQWFRGQFMWVPLQTKQMGGIFLYGTRVTLTASLRARIEFLIRNLEVSIENNKKLIEAKELTYIDDVTGLYNARYLDVSMTSAIENVRIKKSGFCVLFIDIDYFKSVNDTYGHLVGTESLNQMAQLLKNSLRKSDLVFRYGGDEFIAVLLETPAKLGAEIAERLRIQIEKRQFKCQDKILKLTVSIGIARFPEHGTDKNTVLEMADNAMYAGKKGGRNLVFSADILLDKK